MEFQLKDCCFNYDCNLDCDDLVRSISLNIWAPFAEGAKCSKCNNLVMDDIQKDATKNIKVAISAWESRECYGKNFY